MANWWDTLGTQAGDSLIGMQLPFGMAPPTDPAERARMINPMLMRIGGDLLAGAKRNNPAVNIGNAISNAQQFGADQMGRNLYAAQIMQSQAEKKAEKERQNQTLEWLKKTHPDLYYPGMTGEDAGKIFQSTLKSNAGEAEYGLQPIWAKGPDGKWGLFQPNKAGGSPGQMQFPNGYEPQPTVTYHDTGLGYVGTETKGGGIAGPTIPKDVAGENQQKAIGTGMGQRVVDQPEAFKAKETAIAAIDRMGKSAAELKSSPGFPKLWGLWSMVPNIPGGEAANAQARLDTLKNQIFGSTLQAMRDASKTGGALGAITEKEGARLENMLVALAQTQDAEQAGKMLDEIIAYTQDVTARLNQAYSSAYPDSGGDSESSWTTLPNGVRIRQK